MSLMNVKYFEEAGATLKDVGKCSIYQGYGSIRLINEAYAEVFKIQNRQEFV